MLASCMMTSCIEDEASNAECDITAVSVHADNALTLFFNSADTMQHVASTDSVITFTIRTDSDSRLTALAPLLTLTEGATVTPASGTAHDFTKGPAYYTVTSEDRMWTSTSGLSASAATKTLRTRNLNRLNRNTTSGTIR